MNDHNAGILNTTRMPIRLNAEQTAAVLNCQPHDIHILVAEGLLTPLGKPAANGKKYFETKAILAAGDDRKWLIRMTEAIRKTRQDRNREDEREDESSTAKLAA
jgi:hypothetical protein